jgi:hypothetical protein
MVPLSALQATRKKLQDAEAKAQMFQEYYLRAKDAPEQPTEPEDQNALVERKHLNEQANVTKREILEAVFQDNNPKAVQEINNYLQLILEKKPWLAASVDSAVNRYARAYEIIQDYKHLLDEKPIRKAAISDGQRIVQNANKPRSPVEIGNTARPEGAQYLKSIQGKPEFREYRQRVMRGEQ